LRKLCRIYRLEVIVLEDILEQYAMEVEQDKDFAQILIFINNNLTLEKAKDIIDGLGIQILNSKRFSPNIFLLKLETVDMRNVVLKLTENGFLEIRGYNASSFKSKP